MNNLNAMTDMTEMNGMSGMHDMNGPTSSDNTAANPADTPAAKAAIDNRRAADKAATAATTPATTPARASAAAPIVEIYDSGRSIPASSYLRHLLNPDRQAPGPVMPGLEFPLRSALRAGVLAGSIQVFDQEWLTSPIFLLGADKRSLLWLDLYLHRLLRERATGLIVQARSEEDFRAVRTAASQLEFAPARGAWLASRLIAAGVRVYPLLITVDGRARQQLDPAWAGIDPLLRGPVQTGVADPTALISPSRGAGDGRDD